MKRILLSLHSGFGLGDIVQFSVVLKHLRQYRPSWQIDFRAAPGCAEVGRGLCHHWSSEPFRESDYDEVIELQSCEDYMRFKDRPSSKVAFLLEHTFGIPYDAELGGYEVQVTEGTRIKVQNAAAAYNLYPFIVLHYQGSSNTANKDLEHGQAQKLGDAIYSLGCNPWLLDSEGKSPLARPICRPMKEWHGAEILAALISESQAFIGIDSGPGKVASATNTPTLIIWTQHHPLRYHDPAPNTTHLIPENWREMWPVLGDKEMEMFFTANYAYREYEPGSLVEEATKWLREVLHVDHRTRSERPACAPG